MLKIISKKGNNYTTIRMTIIFFEHSSELFIIITKLNNKYCTNLTRNMHGFFLS